MAIVPTSELRPVCDPAMFDFETTADVPPHIGLIGQDRAIDAIKFGLSIESRGFNICVTGESGTGRTTAIREYLETFAGQRRPPDEWCYVNNFQDPHRPIAIKLPPGRGVEFSRAMASMIEEARERIPRAFASEDFVKRRDEIVRSVQLRREQVYSELASRARQNGFSLQGDPSGFFLVPLTNDKPMDDQAFAALEEETRNALLARREQLMEELRNVMKQEQGYDASAASRLAELQQTIAETLVGTLTAQLMEEFNSFPAVITYLHEVRRHMVAHIEDFIRPIPEGVAPQPMPFPMPTPSTASPFRQYEVNLLVDCSQEQCATVVFELNPTPQRLFGRIEKEAMFGAVTTDFTMIQGGSMHQANGGYLVFDFDDLLQYPLSWIELKRTIRTGQLTIEEMGDRLGYIETKTVRPEPIPWTGKIIAIAREQVYRQLHALDPDFRELFKIKADFDMHIPRTPENIREYAGLMSAVTRREGLLPLDRTAVAKVVEEGTRMAEDHFKLSIRFGDLTDIVREADEWATQAGAKVITAEHISHAIGQRERRVNLVEEHVRDAMTRGIIVVDTTGEAIGQVNGLSVVSLGDTAFGQPSRITATTGVGREGVIDIGREAQLSGPIHSKAVMTLQGFLVDRYAEERPIALAARLSFEQSYGMIEGDSATCAETCALLSRIAELPVTQSLAITGSMDQLGEVQAIGGANQKIEGFFDVCNARGLTGEQGVIIPASNVQHLMLREDVVQAVADGKFVVHAITTIDEALELLTGVKAGTKGTDGKYPPASINGLVLAGLERIAEHLHAAATPPETDDGKDGEASEGKKPRAKRAASRKPHA